MRRIRTAAELTALAHELGVTMEWHEPENEGVRARVEGTIFDNAGFWPESEAPSPSWVEQYVVIEREGVPVAAVNLASLLAMASFPYYWATSPRVSS